MKILVLTEEKQRSKQREDKRRGAQTLSLFQKKLIEKFAHVGLFTFTDLLNWHFSTGLCFIYQISNKLLKTCFFLYTLVKKKTKVVSFAVFWFKSYCKPQNKRTFEAIHLQQSRSCSDDDFGVYVCKSKTTSDLNLLPLQSSPVRVLGFFCTRPETHLKRDK